MWDLERDPGLGRALAARADVVLEGFRPGVADRLGIGAAALAGVGRVLLDHRLRCGRHARRSRPQLRRLGRTARGHRARRCRRCRSPTSPAARSSPSSRSSPRCSSAQRSGPRHAPHRLDDAQRPQARRAPAARRASERTLTGGLACYRTYETADGRFLTVTRGRAEVLAAPLRADRPPRSRRASLRAGPGGAGRRSSPRCSGRGRSATGSTLFEGEDVMVGPVATLAEASEWLGEAGRHRQARPLLGEHTERWRADLASFEG